MKRLLWVRSSHCVAVHTDTEPGVWLRSFHSLDTDGQNEVTEAPKPFSCGSSVSFTSKHAASDVQHVTVETLVKV